MARIDQRDARNAAGPWFVDTRCIDCGTCHQLVPELFAAVGDQSVVAVQPDDADGEHRAWLAAEACPTQSIGRTPRVPRPAGLYPLPSTAPSTTWATPAKTRSAPPATSWCGPRGTSWSTPPGTPGPSPPRSTPSGGWPMFSSPTGTTSPTPPGGPSATTPGCGSTRPTGRLRRVPPTCSGGTSRLLWRPGWSRYPFPATPGDRSCSRRRHLAVHRRLVGVEPPAPGSRRLPGRLLVLVDRADPIVAPPGRPVLAWAVLLRMGVVLLGPSRPRGPGPPRRRRGPPPAGQVGGPNGTCERLVNLRPSRRGRGVE